MTSRRRWKVDSPFPNHNGRLSLGGDGKGASDFVDVLLQVAWDDGMDVDDDDANLPRRDVLVMDEVCVQRDKDSILPLSRPEEIAVVKVGSPLVVSQGQFVGFEFSFLR